MKISTFTFKGQDIDMTYQKGHLAYSFKRGDDTYGYKIKLSSRNVLEIASVTFQLITNAIETMEALNENQGLRTGTEENQSQTNDSSQS